MPDAHPQVTVTSRTEWRAWLAEHHASARGVWLVTYKKRAGAPHVTYDEVVEEAVAHGWIDSQSRKLDDRRSQLLITPSRPKSGWSRSNKERVARLTAAGLMTPAGLAAIETAKANGAWEALDAVESLTEPGELREALDADAAARRHWDAFPRSAKRAILEWIGNAKKPETRTRRIRETARLAAQDVRANQWRPPAGR